MEEDEEAMLDLELVSGTGNGDDVEDDSLMMALDEEDSLFGTSELAEGQDPAPLRRTPIKKARLVRGGSLTDFLSQELDDDLAPTAAAEPHSQPIADGTNGVTASKETQDVINDTKGVQEGLESTLGAERTTADGDSSSDVAEEDWESQVEADDSEKDENNSDDLMSLTATHDDEGEQEGESGIGDDQSDALQDDLDGSSDDDMDGDNDDDDEGGEGGEGVDDDVALGEDVSMRDSGVDEYAADDAEQASVGSEEKAQCVCVSLTENGESFYCFEAPSPGVGDGEAVAGDSSTGREELVVLHDRPELYRSPLSAFMLALQEELSMANDVVLEFPGLGLKFYTNLSFAEKLSLFDLAFLHSKLNLEGCLTAEITEESTNFLARYNELVALSQAEPADTEAVLGKRSIVTGGSTESATVVRQPLKRRRS